MIETKMPCPLCDNPEMERSKWEFTCADCGTVIQISSDSTRDVVHSGPTATIDTGAARRRES